MSIKVIYTIDDDFTTNDLKIMLEYSGIACALHAIQYHLMRIDNGKECLEFEKMTNEEFLHYLIQYVDEQMEDLPDLSNY